MPTNVPVPAVTVGQVYTTTLYENYLRQNMNKLLNTCHRVLTVAQFSALTSPEGTKGTVAPDEVYLEVDATNGVLWHLAYESGETTYKWRYIGGPALRSSVVTTETTTSATYAALATAGPTVTLPRAGDYDVTEEMTADMNVAAQTGYMSYDIGGTAAVDADAVCKGGIGSSAGASLSSVSRTVRKTGLTSVALTAKYRITGGGATLTAANRALIVKPVRIRHDA